MPGMKSSDTTDEENVRRGKERGPEHVQSPALVPAARNHADKFVAAAKASRACAPNASHWDRVHAAAGIEP
jgi:hypothetical protein